MTSALTYANMKRPRAGRIWRAAPIVLSFAWAASNSSAASTCTGTYNLGSYNSVSNTDGLVGSTGCEQLDKIFSNFSYSPSSTGPAGSSISVAFSGASETGGISDQFGDDSGTATWTLDNSQSNRNQIMTATQTNEVTVDTGYGNYAITQVALTEDDLAILNGANGTSGEVLMTFCTNSSVTCTSTDSNFGEIILYVPHSTNNPVEYYECYNGNSTGCSATPTFTATGTNSGAAVTFTETLALNATNIYSMYLSNEVIMTTANGATDSVVLSGYQDTVFESAPAVPEPSSFVLLGSALLGASFFKLRKPRS